MVIYKTTNLINDKIYVGKDKNNNPKYLGSGKLLLAALKKYGKKNFKKEILEDCLTIDELNKREIYWIEQLNATDRQIGYNLLKGGQGGAVEGRLLSEETKRKISNKLQGHTVSEKTKILMSQNGTGVSRNKGRKLSDKTKEKIRVKRLQSINAETIMPITPKPPKPLKKRVAWNKGKSLSEDTKRKISSKLTGKIQSKETIEKRKNTICLRMLSNEKSENELLNHN
jgi:group I intron endonuclease